MNAGTLTIEMAMNLARLAADMATAKGTVTGAMRDINSAVSTVKTALGALGIGLSVDYFVNFLKGTNDAIAHMKEFGQEAGVGAVELSRFEAPARTAGLSLETVAAAMFKMNKASLEAKDPQSNAAQALRAIGISTEQLKGLKPDEMFELVARSISKYSDGLEKNNVMQVLFGKSGREMNRVVAEIAERGKLAATVTQEQVEAAKKLNDTTVELTMNSEKFWRGLVADGAPALNEILKAFLEARKEGSFLDGVISGLSKTFEIMANDTTEKKLAEVNAQIKILKETMGPSLGRSVFEFFSLGNAQEQTQNAAKMNELLARRAMLEAAIWQQEFEAQVKRQAATPEKKRGIDFDPVEAEKRRKIAFEQAKQLQEDQDDQTKGLLAHYAHLNALRNEEIALSQKYQEVAAAEVAMRASQGEVIAQGLDTEAEIENLAYQEKLVRLTAYFATKEDFTVQDQARLEALQQQHEFNLIGMNSFGIKSRVEIQKMGGEQQLAYYTGTLANITAAGAQHDRKLFELNKIAGIANAIISANIGAAAALKWGWPMGPIFAGIIWAAAAANINAIRSAQFGGGTSAPSIGGGSATPTFPAQGSPQPAQQTGPSSQPVFNITITGVVDQTVVGQLVDALKDVINSDGVIIPPNSRQAAVITQGI